MGFFVFSGFYESSSEEEKEERKDNENHEKKNESKTAENEKILKKAKRKKMKILKLQSQPLQDSPAASSGDLPKTEIKEKKKEKSVLPEEKAVDGPSLLQRSSFDPASELKKLLVGLWILLFVGMSDRCQI